MKWAFRVNFESIEMSENKIKKKKLIDRAAKIVVEIITCNGWRIYFYSENCAFLMGGSYGNFIF